MAWGAGGRGQGTCDAARGGRGSSEGGRNRGASAPGQEEERGKRVLGLLAWGRLDSGVGRMCGRPAAGYGPRWVGRHGVAVHREREI